MVTSAPDDVERLFDTANKRLVRERRRTADELDAFRGFEDEIRGMETEPVPLDGGVGTNADVVGKGNAMKELRAVRETYESTVMGVPHYADEYDDIYPESIAEEFGPDLATALTGRGSFDERCKQAVLSAASEAQERRQRLLEILETETESLVDARKLLVPVADELDELGTAPLSDLEFETLDAYRTRLAVLKDRCEERAVKRQSTLAAQRRNLRLPVDGPDIATYVYQSLDVDYPVLSAITVLVGRIDELRASVERAMGYCD